MESATIEQPRHRPQPRIRPITKKRFEPAEPAAADFPSKETPASALVEELIQSTVPTPEARPVVRPPIEIRHEERNPGRGLRSVKRLAKKRVDDNLFDFDKQGVTQVDETIPAEHRLENFSSEIEITDEPEVATPVEAKKVAGVQEVPEVKKQPEVPLADRIQQTETLDQLKELLAAQGKLIADRDVVRRIQDAEDYFNDNINEIIGAVITSKSNAAMESLRKLIGNVTTGGELGIQQQVRVLFRKQTESRFRDMEKSLSDRRPDVVIESVKDAQSFADLAHLVRQFRQVRDGGQLVDATEVLLRIDRARQAALTFANGPDVLRAPLHTLESFVTSMIREQRIPADSGIDQTARRLLLDQIRERRLEREAEAAQNTWAAKAQRTVSRIFGWR